MTTRALRVCLISREYPPETGFGGIATFTRHLAHGLKELGHDVEVVSLSKDVDKIADDNGIKVHRVNNEWLGKSLYAFSMFMPYSRYVLLCSTALWKKFHEIHAREPFDVVDTPELLAEGLIPGITRALPLLIRLYTPHSKFIKEGLHNVTQSFDHEFVAALERVAMVSADVLTSPSQDLKEYVAQDLHYDPERIHIVRNPIDPQQFSPDGELAPCPQDKIRILFVGRLEERKGIHYLIEAIPGVVARHKDVEFTIIGDDTKTGTGQGSVRKELEKIIERDGTASFIRFIDRIPLTSLAAYYRSADICVVPSVYDNSPYTCLEAMACGRPVVGTSGGGTKEYVIDGECGIIVEPRDPQSLSQAINRLLDNPEWRRQLGEQARRRVLQHFQRREIARQTAELYYLAIDKFKQSPRASFYHKPPDMVLADATFMLKTFDKMLYDKLFQMSYRFRIRHWFRLLKARPRLFSAKLMLKLTDKACALTGRKVGALTNLQAWLLREIKLKSPEQSFGTEFGVTQELRATADQTAGTAKQAHSGVCDNYQEREKSTEAERLDVSSNPDSEDQLLAFPSEASSGRVFSGSPRNR